MEWSVSKLATLRQCHRKFYFAQELADHHFTHPVRRKAFELSQSKSLRMWKGALIDHAFSNWVIPVYKDKKLPDFLEISERLVGLAKRQFAFSASRRYHEKGISKTKAGDDFAILDIHESGVPFYEEEVSEVYELIRKIILQIPFLPSPDPGQTLHEYLRAASYLRSNIQYWRYEFQGVTLNPQIDMVRYKDKSIQVIDWKVAESDSGDYSTQLFLAGIVAYHNIKKEYKDKGWMPPTQQELTLYEYNLMNGSIRQHSFNRETTARALDYVFKFREEQEMLSAGRKWNELNITDYITTDKKETCMFCKFKPLCIHLILNKYSYDEVKYTQLVQDHQLAGA